MPRVRTGCHESRASCALRCVPRLTEPRVVCRPHPPGSRSVRCVRFCEGQYSKFLTVVDPFSSSPASLNVFSLAEEPQHRALCPPVARCAHSRGHHLRAGETRSDVGVAAIGYGCTELDHPDLPIVDTKHPRLKIAQAEWIQMNRFILAAYGNDLRVIDPQVCGGRWHAYCVGLRVPFAAGNVLVRCISRAAPCFALSLLRLAPPHAPSTLTRAPSTTWPSTWSAS